MTRKEDKQRDETLILLLGSLVEDSGHVQESVGAVLRWGLTATDAHGACNRDNLLRDLDSVKSSIRRIEKELAPSMLLGVPDPVGLANGQEAERPANGQ